MHDFNLEEHLKNIDNDGFTIIKKAVDLNVIENVVNDFDNWCKDSDFQPNSFNRVTNFHIYSKNTLDLVTNKYVNLIMEKSFGTKQCVYSSLFFREGTSQHFHVDTPHFYTNPINKYFGVWYALEDIHQNAGPLKYYIKSHKLETLYGYETYNKLYKNKDSISNDENLNCLIDYNKSIENLCQKNNLEKIDETNYKYKIEKGDIIIWHPNLLHGGSDIIDSSLTRYSMVTHNIPVGIPVFNAGEFFRKEPSREYINNTCKFEYIIHNDIHIVNHFAEPRVQRTYL